jgi:ABC-type sugar transport system ATPase subunit
MGRAIVRRPRVFLFDEPLSNLDARLRLHMRVELQGLHRSLGATSLYVTHDQVEAMTLADRIVLLNGGVVQQIGAPLDLYERPTNEFVATFLGHPTMNLLDGSIESGVLSVAGACLKLGACRQPAGPVRVGVRPQHLRLADDGPAIAAEVVAFEPLGGESLLHCDAMGQRLVASVGSEARVSVGEVIRLVPSVEQFVFFDVETRVRR